jgi:hypothetical protein
MDDICFYHLEVRGQVDEKAFNASSPLQVTVIEGRPAASRLTVRADQSGVIGLLRHLHRQGFVLLSLQRQQEIVKEDRHA